MSTRSEWTLTAYWRRSGMNSCCATCASLLALSHLVLDTCRLSLSFGLVSKLLFLLPRVVLSLFWLLPCPFALLVHILPPPRDSIAPVLSILIHSILFAQVLFSYVEPHFRQVHSFDGDRSVAIFVHILGLVVDTGRL